MNILSMSPDVSNDKKEIDLLDFVKLQLLERQQSPSDLDKGLDEKASFAFI